MEIRIPARKAYDTLEDYITRINKFDYSSDDMNAFRAILNSNIEPHHLERCILWYNSFDRTLHDRQPEWDVPVRRAQPVYLQDQREIARKKYDEETHAILRELAEKGNPPPAKTQKELNARIIANMKAEDPERYAEHLKGRPTKKRSFLSVLGFGGTRRLKRR